MIPKYSLKTLLMILTAATFVLAVPLLASRHLNATVRDGYSQQIVAVLVMKFMDQNQGMWPRSWSSLEPIFSHDQGHANPDAFEELKQRVFLDFNADVDRMREDALKFDKPTFRVLYAKFTSGFHPMGDPNEAIHHYLRETFVASPILTERIELQGTDKAD